MPAGSTPQVIPVVTIRKKTKRASGILCGEWSPSEGVENNVPAIGITGGISTGKTTFSDCLREIIPGAHFFDADQAARDLADFDPDVRKELEAEFGAAIYSANGDLNRAQLRVIILESADKKSALENILHPRIRRQWSAEVQKHRQPFDFFFADIPLLYETGGEALCDRVVVVACSPDVQMSRLLQRGSIDRSAAEEMIKTQMPIEDKIKRADHVVWNNAGRSILMKQAELLIQLCQH
jgi:dephospho-CoA kinase